MVANICKAPTGSHYTGSLGLGEPPEKQVMRGLVHVHGEVKAKRMV